MESDTVTAAAFTVFVRHSVRLFSDEAVVKKYETILLTEAEKSQCDAPVYLFLPTKCHLLLQGKGGLARLVGTMKGFRLGAGYWLSKVYCDMEWLGNHRSDEKKTQLEILQYARHILNAPVRMGIVDDWKQYRYKGSSLYQLESWP